MNGAASSCARGRRPVLSIGRLSDVRAARSLVANRGPVRPESLADGAAPVAASLGP
jgi:hypothetical protein